MSKFPLIEEDLGLALHHLGDNSRKDEREIFKARLATSDFNKRQANMSDWKQVRDEAAATFCGPNPHRAPTWPVRLKAFKAGYDYAIANDPRVEKMREALEHYESAHYCNEGYPCSHDKTAREALKAFEGD